MKIESSGVRRDFPFLESSTEAYTDDEFFNSDVSALSKLIEDFNEATFRDYAYVSYVSIIMHRICMGFLGRMYRKRTILIRFLAVINPR